MGIRVVDRNGRRIGLSRSILRTVIKFLPWEIAHFGIWNVMLPSAIPENTALLFLTAANAAIFLYLIIPLTNSKRKNVYDWVAGTEVV